MRAYFLGLILAVFVVHMAAHADVEQEKNKSTSAQERDSNKKPDWKKKAQLYYEKGNYSYRQRMFWWAKFWGWALQGVSALL